MNKSKKLLSAVLAIVMIVSASFTNLALTVYGDDENIDASSDLVASAQALTVTTDSNGDARLEWPAVDQDGNVISGAALKSDSPDGIALNGTPVSGPVILNNKIVKGYDGQIAGDGNPVIDETVIADSYCPAYKIEYSKDGVNYQQMSIVARTEHGKKLGTSTSATKFLISPQQYTIMGLDSNTNYYFKVTAYASKTEKSDVIRVTDPVKEFDSVRFTSPVKTPAFPTAEGGGKYSLGGRGGDVYTVTNLEDDHTSPIPGSLRYGLKRLDLPEADRTNPRTIVFAVSGVIYLTDSLDITSNTTVAGQTAPGEGITISGVDGAKGDTKIHGDNIILRYIRFKMNESVDRDTITVSSARNVIIDHCSVGWGVDETFTVKETLNSTFQYNIINQALQIPKGGSEAEIVHGMAAIWDGNENTFHHNIIANCGSRNPRFQGGFKYYYNRYENRLDYSNNLVYNWGGQGGYGSDRGDALMNFTNNYYKPGPNTQEKVKNLFFDLDTSSSYGTRSSVYFSGNVMEGSDELTNDNSKGFKDLGTQGDKLDNPAELLIKYTPESAQDAYNNMLKQAGAVLPKRDAQDAKLINDIMNDTGRIINSPSQVGGYPQPVVETSAPADTDKDGIPDEWETKNGLDANDPADGRQVTASGYTNLEVYLNELAGDYENAVTNPTVSLKNINDQHTFTVGSTTVIEAEAAAQGSKTISKIELYLNDTLLGEFANNQFSFNAEKEGTYNLIAKAYDSDGLSTFSQQYPININYANSAPAGWSSSDVGNVGAAGSTAFSPDYNQIIMKGAGRVNSTNDTFHYTYKKMTGDCEIVARIDEIEKIAYEEKAGIMIRDSLDDNSSFAFAALTLLKGETYPTDAFGTYGKSKRIKAYYRNSAGSSMSQGKNYAATIIGESTDGSGAWAKLKKTGNTVTIYVSPDGADWKVLQESTLTFTDDSFYVGLAIDAMQDTHKLVTYNRAVFSNVSLDGKVVTAPVEAVYGDVDFDGQVTANDAAIILEYILDKNAYPLSNDQIKRALVSSASASEPTTADVSEILKKSLNPEYKFPVEG